MQKTYPLSKYLQSVKKLVTQQVPAVWVHGVLSQVQMRDRVCYLSLAEYAEGETKAICTLSLVVFAKELEMLERKLGQAGAPTKLQEQMKVSVLLQADFHIPQGRFQAKIVDIDPVYTLGELALTKKAILERLYKEGLLRKNAELRMPLVPLRIGLITAPGSAAHHDFMDVLWRSHFAFQVELRGAKMQGNDAETTILEAIGQLRQMEPLDVLCIVRGGGSKTDLNAFDSEAICRAVAVFPSPVLSGIGHEIDRSLLDEVAWKSCITPTDTAKFLVNTVDLCMQNLEGSVQSIAERVSRRVDLEKQRFRLLSGNIVRSFPRRLGLEQDRLDRDRQGLRLGVGKIQMMHQLRLEPIPQRLQRLATLPIERNFAKLELWESKIQAVSPQKILERGYSLATLGNGKIPRNKADLPIGELIKTRWKFGTVLSRIEESLD